MKIHVKYMVSYRCKLVVKSALDELGIEHNIVHLGEVVLKEELSKEQHDKLEIKLRMSGLELMDSKKPILVEKIKIIIVEMVHYSDELPTMNFSHFLSEKLDHNYTYLANLFSLTTGTTIENYIIIQKVEKMKELLLYDELNISEISFQLGYSSPAHMSSQFKRITGLTPSFFKKMKKYKMRITLEDL